MNQKVEIRRVSHLGAKKFWSTHGSAAMPVIIEKSVPDWRSSGDWSIDYLRNAIGHHSAALNRGYFDESSSKKLPMGEILDAIESGSPSSGHEHPYLRNIDVWGEFPELIESLSPRLEYISPNWMSCVFLPQHVPDGLVEFFLGGRGASFPKLHIDTHGTHAFITQLIGCKHIVVAPPDSTEMLNHEFGHPEKFTLDCDSATKKRLGIIETTINPGDTLFVPAGWWHTTYMSEISMSVSSNCLNSTNWQKYVDAVTKHTPGLKRPAKRAVLRGIGVFLRLMDSMGVKSFYRAWP